MKYLNVNLLISFVVVMIKIFKPPGFSVDAGKWIHLTSQQFLHRKILLQQRLLLLSTSIYWVFMPALSIFETFSGESRKNAL